MKKKEFTYLMWSVYCTGRETVSKNLDKTRDWTPQLTMNFFVRCIY